MKTHQRLFPLDLIRIVAMLLIVLNHYVIEGAHAGFRTFSVLYDIYGVSPAHIGVSLFIALSGAALMVSTKKFEWKSYVKKRLLAIFPAYLTIWAGAIVLRALLMPHALKGIPLWTLILTFTGMDGLLYRMIPNFYQVGEWYIGTILLLYACFPLLYFGIKRKPVLTGVLLIGIQIIGMTFYPFRFISPYHNFYLRLTDLYFGMCLVQYKDKIRIRQTISVGVILLIAGLLYNIRDGAFETIRAQLTGWGVFLLLLAAGAELQRKKPFVSENKFIRLLSEASFEVFLTHHIFIQALMRYVYPHISFMQNRFVFTLCLIPVFFLDFAISLLIHKVLQRLMHLKKQNKT